MVKPAAGFLDWCPTIRASLNSSNLLIHRLAGAPQAGHRVFRRNECEGLCEEARNAHTILMF